MSGATLRSISSRRGASVPGKEGKGEKDGEREVCMLLLLLLTDGRGWRRGGEGAVGACRSVFRSAAQRDVFTLAKVHIICMV